MIPIASMEEFIEYGFKPCKSPYKGCYYLCVSRGIKMLFVSESCFMINKWDKNDPRIHKRPNCRYSDKRTVEDILVDLVKKGMVDSEYCH